MNPTAQAADPGDFRYGWRFVPVPGGEALQVPLTLEDVLHPQEGDTIVETPVHRIDRAYLTDVFEARLQGPRHAFVTSDLGIDLGLPGVRVVAPDVGCFVGLREPPDLAAGLLRLRGSGGRCLTLVELVSPHTRENDVERKLDLYHRAEVPLYAIIDQEREGDPRRLVAYRWTQAGYEEAPLADGWLEMPFLGLRLGVQDGRAACCDLATGQEIGNYAAITLALEQAAAREQEREQEMELMVERSRETERARTAAEALARREALARTDAEAKAVKEAQARADAEAKAAKEAQARTDADARLAALAAEMDLLREQLRRLQPPA